MAHGGTHTHTPGVNCTETKGCTVLFVQKGHTLPAKDQRRPFGRGDISTYLKSIPGLELEHSDRVLA
jgi:hypothetical protein